MPIFHDIETIFIHIPKTGGVSVYDCLGGEPEKGIETLYGLHYGDDCKDRFGHSAVIMQHLSAQMIKNEVGDLWDGYNKIAFVRNPYDRLVSVWNYGLDIVSKNERINHPCYWSGQTFDEFVVAVDNKINSPDGAKSHNVMCHFYSQTWFLQMADGKISEDVFIGKYECFETDLRMYVYQKTDKALNEIPHKNGCSHDPWSEYYNKIVTIEAVNRLYKQDFLSFGYKML